MGYFCVLNTENQVRCQCRRALVMTSPIPYMAYLIPASYFFNRSCSSDRCFCSPAGTPLCSSCSVGCPFNTSATQSKLPGALEVVDAVLLPPALPCPRLTRLLFPTLVAACYRQKENSAILQQEISPRLLVAFLQENLQAIPGGQLCCSALCVFYYLLLHHTQIRMTSLLSATAFLKLSGRMPSSSSAADRLIITKI